jgi:hypothetical protein
MDKYQVTIDDEQALNLLEALVDAIALAENRRDWAQDRGDVTSSNLHTDKYFAYSKLHDDINNQIVDVINARV